MKKYWIAVLALISVFGTALADSEADYPEPWRQWPVLREGRIPPSDESIDGYPSVVRETYATYSWINGGKGSPYKVRINPVQMKTLKTANDFFSDSPTAVLEIVDIGVIFVTEHFLGEPQYGAYSFDGEDVSGKHKSLAPRSCIVCHSGYDVFNQGITKLH